MFILVQLKDSIRIPPAEAALLQEDILHHIRQELNARYANKVVHNVGLCIIVHSILAHDDPHLFPGDAGAYIMVNFRVVVFQPSRGEILMAQIKAFNHEKFLLSLEFFDHVIVEAADMPQNASFDKERRVWVYSSDDGDLDYSVGTYVYCRVVNFKFASEHETSEASDLTTSQQNALLHGYAQPTEASQAQLASPTQAKPYVPPFVVCASMSDAGLGPVEWWQ